MSHLCVSTCEAIKTLAPRGWSGRRITRELAVNQETVARYTGPSKPAIPSPGSAPWLRGHRHGLSAKTRHSLSELQLVEPGVPELPDQLNDLGLIATPASSLEVMHPTPSPESEKLENHDEHRTITLKA